MRVNVVMPQMGESIAEGTIIKWAKKIGERVESDETLLEISTDKVDSEIPSPVSGVVVECLAREGETVAVGTVIAVIETGAEGEGKMLSESEVGMQAPSSPQEQQPAPETVTRPEVKITPVARSIAAKESIPLHVLASISGSGFRGRILKQDVLRFLQQSERKPPEEAIPPSLTVKTKAPPEAVPPPGRGRAEERVPMDHIRKSIAHHMVTSVRTSPHVTSVHEVDVSEIMAYLVDEQKRFREREGVKLTLTSFVAQAAVKALQAFPVVNASIEEDTIVYHHEINLGIAVALENGLIVPVIRRADELSLVGLTKAISNLAFRARNKKLSPEEVQGGTFSITNYGVFDTLIGTPIIHQPQVAILGTGTAKQRPVAVNDMIAIRWMMYLSLTYDHRLLDGAVGGRFLQFISEWLENFHPDIVK